MSCPRTNLACLFCWHSYFNCCSSSIFSFFKPTMTRDHYFVFFYFICTMSFGLNFVFPTCKFINFSRTHWNGSYHQLWNILDMGQDSNILNISTDRRMNGLRGALKRMMWEYQSILKMDNFSGNVCLQTKNLITSLVA